MAEEPIELQRFREKIISKQQPYEDFANKSFNAGQKTVICELLQSKIITIKEFVENHHIPQRTLYRWLKDYKGQVEFNDLGRPKYLDKTSEVELGEKINAADREKRPLSPNQLNTEIARERINTLQRTNTLKRKRGKDGDDPLEEDVIDDDEDPCRKVVYRVKKRMKLSVLKSQPLTHAREMACSDPRASYSWLAVNVALCGSLKATHKWNMDPTTLKIDDSGLLSVVSKEEESSCQNSNAVSDTAIFLKFICACSASGELADIVIGVAIDSLPDDVYYVYAIHGLSPNIGDRFIGYILITKTRAGNAASWKWYFETILIPTINHVKNISKAQLTYQDDSGEEVYKKMHAVLSYDGEYIALEAGMQPEVLELFRTSDIHCIKIPASTSSLHQACDRSTVFRNLKTGLKTLNEQGIPVPENEIMRDDIQDAFDQLFEESKVSVPAGFKEKVYKGCLKLSWLFKEKYVKQSHIVKGFTCCGQHKNISDDTVLETEVAEQGLAYSSVDYNKILDQCYTEIEGEDRAHMIQSLPKALDELNNHGCLTDQFMDNEGILKNPDHKPRDELVLNRQYAVVLTHYNVSGSFHNYLADRFIRTDRNEIAKRKELEQQRKIVERYEEEERKKKKKADDEALEKQRRQSLSKEERRLEDERNKKQKEEKKTISRAITEDERGCKSTGI